MNSRRLRFTAPRYHYLHVVKFKHIVACEWSQCSHFRKILFSTPQNLDKCEMGDVPFLRLKM